ncbi:MAG: tetratricopeptide repeat protein [Leptolyngbyaceae cyanobacterium MO_188.B28]|nr:tetratricopeptide repeat protein [Leptolyngbyaceae cyanobacterium MO_188.B28]
MKNRRWLNFTEFLLLLGTGAGAMASVATLQMFYITAPLSLLAAVGLLNRKQFEHQTEKNVTSLEDIDERMFQNVSQLQEQLNALPSPEALTNFQRSVVAHNDRSNLRFTRELEKTSQQLEQRLQEMQPPDLSHLYQDIEQLNDQYAHLAVSFTNLTKQVQNLSNLPRVEAAEEQIAQLKTGVMQMQVNLETFSGESRTTFSQLQASVQNFEQRLRRLPAEIDPKLLQEEVKQLTQIIPELAARRDLSDVAINVQELGERQQLLSESIEVLREMLTQRLQTLATESVAGHSAEESSEGSSDAVRQELNQLTAGLVNLEQQLESLQVQTYPQIEFQQAVTAYLNEFQEKQQQQLGRLKKCADFLEVQQKQVNGQLKKISPNLDAAALGQQVEVLSSRLEATENQVTEVERSLAGIRPTNPALAVSAETEWIVDLQPKSPLQRDSNQAIPPSSKGSRAALEKALEQAQERLILVWPWAAQCELDESMIEKFQQLLNRQCHLEIGWCHLGDRRDGRFIRTISQRWRVESGQKRLLKNALNKLLPLKQSYPDHFKFKILGTDENFLVCDDTFAILGVQQLAASNTVFPELSMKLRTTEPQVIDELTKRFDDPTLDPQDAVAYFNRAGTRQDLGDYWGAIADYTQVLCIHPWDATVYNNRGLIWADLNESAPAITDFSDAIKHNSDSFSAYCNRGVLQLEQGDLQDAIADLNKAVELNPLSPIPYFYRGSALQKVGNLSEAIEDYGAAIERSDNIALPYCYRGAAYQKIGDTRRAIADLELAAELLKGQNDSNNLTQVMRTLNKLKGNNIVQSVVATHSAS